MSYVLEACGINGCTRLHGVRSTSRSRVDTAGGARREPEAPRGVSTRSEGAAPPVPSEPPFAGGASAPVPVFEDLAVHAGDRASALSSRTSRIRGLSGVAHHPPGLSGA